MTDSIPTLAALRSSPNRTVAGCGCEWGNVDNKFLYAPCSKDCHLYQYALRKAEEQGRSVEHHMEVPRSWLN